MSYFEYLGSIQATFNVRRLVDISYEILKDTKITEMERTRLCATLQGKYNSILSSIFMIENTKKALASIKAQKVRLVKCYCCRKELVIPLKEYETSHQDDEWICQECMNHTDKQ